MIRKIIHIDQDKCNGCGLCAKACHEGAIGMENGKAKLLRDDYCDGLGDCLPVCPTGAITFEEREALAFSLRENTAVGGNQTGCDAILACEEAAVKATTPMGGCPGSAARSIRRQPDAPTQAVPDNAVSRLSQWPVQIKLVPVQAPYFDGADLLVAADCTAFAHAGFHQNFIRDRVTLIGCPKLDEGDYADKLTEILRQNDIKSVTVARMEVPCCGGIENAVKTALQRSGKMIPWQVAVIATDGRVLAGGF